MKSQDVLKKIQDLATKHAKDKLIGIDTLALTLRIGQPQLLAILKELEEEGKIVMTSSPELSRRRTGSGGVRCVEEN